MSGVRNGVQALMKREPEDCLYVHCFVHSLNLYVQDLAKKCNLVRNCMHGNSFSHLFNSSSFHHESD